MFSIHKAYIKHTLYIHLAYIKLGKKRVLYDLCVAVWAM